MKKIYIARKGPVISGFFMLLLGGSLALLSLYEYSLNNIQDRSWIDNYSALFLTWFFVYFIVSKFFFGNLYTFTNAFIGIVVVFHLTMVFQEAFHGGVMPIEWLSGGFSIHVRHAVLLVFFSIGVFVFASSFSAMMVKNKVVDVDVYILKIEEVKSFGFLCATGLIAASVVFFLMALYSYGDILSYSRHEIFRSSNDSRGFGAFMMVFPGALCLLFFSTRNKLEAMLAVTACFIGFTIFILSGYRSAALFPLVVSVVLWVKLGRKIPVWVSILMLVSIIFVISFSGALRSMGSYDQIDSNKIEAAVESSSYESVVGLSRSLGIVAHSLRLVPSEDPYRYGMSYYIAVKNSLPNIGIDMNVSMGRQSLKRLVQKDNDNIVYMPPSDWMTYRILREQYDIGQGVGFSIIAEPYVNFGLFGVFVFFFLVGLLFGMLDRRTIYSSRINFLFCCVGMWVFLRTTRNDFSNFVKPFVFSLIIIFMWLLLRKFIDSSFRKKHA